MSLPISAHISWEPSHKGPKLPAAHLWGPCQMSDVDVLLLCCSWFYGNPWERGTL